MDIHPNDIESSNQEESELLSARLMLLIHTELFESDEDAFCATVFAATQFRGGDRIISMKDVPLFTVLVEHFGIEVAVAVGLLPDFAFFCHPDCPVLPPKESIESINSLSNTECHERFCFCTTSLRTILSHLPLDNVLRTPSGDKYTLTEGFCLVCIHLAYPCRWCDLRPLFGRHTSALSNIFWDMLSNILHLVKELLLCSHVDAEQWQAYCDAFSSKGSYQGLNIAGALDAKQVRICRPKSGQEAQYTRHKQEHCLKFQTVVVPDGLIFHTTTGQNGRDHDSRVMNNSGLVEFWEASPVLSNYRLIADSAYPNGGPIVSLYTQAQKATNPLFGEFNRTMSPLRQPVEWGYQRVVSLWGLLEMKTQMKIELVSVSDMWLVSVWLTNLVACAERRNIISDFYGGVEPPTLEQYLQMTIG